LECEHRSRGISISRDKCFPLSDAAAETSSATDTGNVAPLLLSTVVMAVLVVSVNRLVWRPLYRRAETRYRMEA
jgi:NitT/TauT family transport system permease protein